MRLQLRVAAVGVHRGRVLLSRGPGDDFWALPGGRVERGESTTEALAREVHEELGVRVAPGRLLWVAESFFRYRDERYHEVGFYYEADLAAARQHEEPWERADETGVRLAWRWLPVAEAPRTDIRPAFLRNGLGALPATPVHVVQRD